MNDPYVIEKWQESSGINKIKFIPDGNGTFTKDMNMISDRSSSGMGERSYRYSTVSYTHLTLPTNREV